LAALDIKEGSRLADPLVTLYADAIPLERSLVHVIDPSRLEHLRRLVARDPGMMPQDAPVSERKLFEELLPPLELLLKELAQDAVGGDPDAWYERVMLRFTQAIPDMMEVVASGSRHPRVILWARGLSELASDLGGKATRLGDSHYAIPIHELSVALTSNPRAAGILAVELTHVGRFDEAKTYIDMVKKDIPGSDPLGAVVRGSLGRIHYARGEKDLALAELDRAWSGLGASAGNGAGILGEIVDRRSCDYWLFVEILTLRYELAKGRDRNLVKQAEFDLDEAINHAAALGKRMIPALAMKGRLEWLRGNTKLARTTLLALLDLPRGGVLDRADRVDHDRYRVLGLKTLLLLIEPEESEVKARVEDQLAMYDRT
jgi:hypothetical protein